MGYGSNQSLLQPHHIEYWYRGEKYGTLNDYAPGINRAFAAGQLRLTPYKKDGVFNLGEPITGVPSYSTIDAPLADFYFRSTDGGFSSATYSDFTFNARLIYFGTAAGHMFSGGQLVRSKLNIGFVNTGQSPSASIYHSSTGASGAGDCYASEFNIRYALRAVGTTIATAVPLFDSVGTTNIFRGNTINIGMCHSPSTSPVIRVGINHASGVYNSGNKYIIPIAEIAYGGLVHIGGEVRSEIDVASYDLPAGGDTSNDAVKVGRGNLIDAAGPESRNVKIKYLNTSPISLIAPGYDINLTGAADCIVETTGGNASQVVRVNCAGGKHLALSNYFVSYDNAANLVTQLS